MGVDLLLGTLVGILIGVGTTGVLWYYDKKRTTHEIKELKQKIREVKVQLWIAWGHKEKYEGD